MYSYAGPFLQAQEPAAAEVPPAITPAIQALLDGLLSDQTEASVRLSQGRALLSDPTAHPKIIEILEQNNNTTAKIVICHAIASRGGDLLPLNGTKALPDTFIEPLFKTLLSEHSDLSSWSGQALATFQTNSVAERLAKLVADVSQTVAQRTAGISALELMSGKAPVLALGMLLTDKEVQIQNRAATALASILALSKPITADQFAGQYKTHIENMDEQTFLRWQLTLKQKQILQTQQNLLSANTQISSLRKWKQAALEAEFSRLPDSNAKLEFLKKNLIDQSEDYMRIWTLASANTWCKAANLQSDPVVGPLVELLTGFIIDPNPKVRELTATALGMLVENAIQTAPNLLDQLTKEAVPQTQAALLETLGIFVYAPATEKALNLLQSEDTNVIIQSVRMLGKICVSQTNPINEEQAKRIIEALAGSYQKQHSALSVKQALVEAMRKIAGQEKLKKLALENFHTLLIQAMQDKEGVIRGPAVYALTDLHGAKVLSLLLEQNNLLNDPDAAVRFAVIDAINNYGGKDQLPLLIQQLGKETNTSAVDTIQKAFLHILEPGDLAEYYKWIVDLQHSKDKVQSLHEQLVLLFLDKIRQAKAASQAVDKQYELEALSQQVRIAQRKGQYDQVAQAYSAMLAVDAATALNHAGQTFDQLDTNDENLMMAGANFIVSFIVPIQSYPTPELKTQWEQRRLKISLKVIESQEKLLAAENGKENPQAIQVLEKLNSQLKGYPALEAPLDERKAKLQQFRTILVPQPQPPPPPAQETPAAAPAPTPAAAPTEELATNK